MKSFYGAMLVICILVISSLWFFHLYTMVWGKIVLTFVSAFFVSLILEVLEKKEK